MDEKFRELCDEYGWDIHEQEDGLVDIVCRMIPDITITVATDDFVGNIEAACDDFSPDKAVYETLHEIEDVQKVPDVSALLDMCVDFESELSLLVAALREATLGQDVMGVNVDIGDRSDPYLPISSIDDEVEVELYFGRTGPGFFTALQVATMVFKAIGDYVERYEELPVRLTIMPPALINCGMCDDVAEAAEVIADTRPFLAGMQTRYEELFPSALIYEPLFVRLSLTEDGCCLTLNEDAPWSAILQYFVNIPDAFYEFSAESNGLALLVYGAMLRNGTESIDEDVPGTLISYLPTPKQAKMWLALDTSCEDPLPVLQSILDVGTKIMFGKKDAEDWDEEDE